MKKEQEFPRETAACRCRAAQPEQKDLKKKKKIQ